MVFTSLTKPLLSLFDFHTRTVVILQNYNNQFNVDSLLIIFIVASVNLTHPSHMIRPYLNIRGYHIILFLKFNLWVVPQGTPQISCSNATYLKERSGIHMKIREDPLSSLLLSSSSSSSSSMSSSLSSLFYLIKQGLRKADADLLQQYRRHLDAHV